MRSVCIVYCGIPCRMGPWRQTAGCQTGPGISGSWLLLVSQQHRLALLWPLSAARPAACMLNTGVVKCMDSWTMPSVVVYCTKRSAPPRTKGTGKTPVRWESRLVACVLSYAVCTVYAVGDKGR